MRALSVVVYLFRMSETSSAFEAIATAVPQVYLNERVGESVTSIETTRVTRRQSSIRPPRRFCAYLSFSFSSFFLSVSLTCFFFLCPSLFPFYGITGYYF